MKNREALKELCYLSLCVAVALIFSFVESQIPTFVPVPGVKIGLANVVSVFVLYRIGGKEALTVSVIRVCLSSVLFGTPIGFLYSLSGALVSLFAMMLLKRTRVFSPIGVSVVGGVLHNFAQLALAALVFESSALLLYLPILAVSGTVAGAVIGIAGGLVIKKVPRTEN